MLVIQTAFPGDVVLTLPLIAALKAHLPGAAIDVLVTPASANLLEGHPAVRTSIAYDKHGSDRGMRGFLRLARLLRRNGYGLALIPHRSLRSALLASYARIPRRCGFDRSAGWMLFSDVVRYDPGRHEIERNLSLLTPFAPGAADFRFPALHPSDADRAVVDAFLKEAQIPPDASMVAVAPGSVWATKRWPEEHYAELLRKLDGEWSVLIGGKEDVALCERLKRASESDRCVVAAGALSLLQSAALIGRCRVLVTNDSAPMHLALAVGTRVVAIFGPTVPEFGFGPKGDSDVVVQAQGLPCRPCAIHGGKNCPLGTLECMRLVIPDEIYGRMTNSQ